jgi:hypothetical protein
LSKQIKEMESKKYIIGGAALRALGSSRSTEDVDYLVNNQQSTETFYFDKDNNIDYINANGHKFFSEVWAMEAENTSETASPQALLELKAFAFVQHCQNFKWQKADDCEFDIKFLVRTFNLTGVKIANKYMTAGELSEVNKVIKSTK